VENRLAGHTPGVGLDLASGEGRNAIWLAGLGWEMTAVDFSGVAIARGREMSDRVRFIEADVLAWEPDRSFDLVLIAYLQIEAEPLSDLVRKTSRWLTDGGELFMIGHDISNIDEGVGGPQVPEILWDVELIVSCLDELTVVESGVVERPVDVEGRVAHARDALVRARA
jgi:ubiquinone/menaquinone biosynthesis C-methylase UbiE